MGLQDPPPKNKSDTSRNTTEGQACTSVGLPYIRGTSEKLDRIFKNHGVGAYHKPFNTLRSILVHPKDKTPDHKKCGVIYEIQCPECPAQYVEEIERIYPGDKDERPPKTEIPTNSCGRPWTSHQNGQCQSDSPRGQHVAMQDPWVHRNQDPPPSDQPRPGIWAPPHLWRTAVMWPLFPAVTWPQRINLICLMEWPWWLCKLATLQHIWLW